MMKIGGQLVAKIPQILTNIKNGFKPLTSFFSELWEGIKKTFSNVESFFSNTFKKGFEAVKNAFSNFKSFFTGLWDSIKTTFSSLGTNIASAIGGAVKSGINGVINIIQNTINKAIGLINGAIGLINKLPGVNVGKVGEVTLPRLARGGIVDRPTVAEIGEAGREAVIPLENNKTWIRDLAKEIKGAIASTSEEKSLNNPFYAEMVSAFKDALSQVKVELDDETMGSFVEKTVADAIYI
jgi:phage-related protein